MHKIRVVILLVVMCGMILWPEVVQAKLVTIEIEVVVDSVLDAGGYLEGKVEAGDIITGWYTYDTSTPDSSPSATWGSYEYYTPPHGIFLSIDGFEFNTDPTNIDFWVQIGNDEGLHHDFYQVRSWNNIFLSNGIPGPLFVENIWWSLVDPSGSALSSDVLPPTPPVVGNWQDNVLGITGPKQIFEVRARVTLAIPEPGTILLFGVGGLIFRLKKKNKRKFQAFF